MPYIAVRVLWRPASGNGVDAQNIVASASGAILSISHTVRRVYLSITLARWRAKMLPECSDLLASTAKSSFMLAPETAAKALRINNQSLEVSWGGDGREHFALHRAKSICAVSPIYRVAYRRLA
jgi:hypothetical protein